MNASEFTKVRDALSRLRDALSAKVQSNGYEPRAGSPAEADLHAWAGTESMHTAHAQAWMLVEVAADQLTAFLKTVTEPVETIAPYTCVRSLLESAALSCWLVEPNVDARSRVARSLALRYEGMEQQIKWARSAGEDPNTAATRLDTIVTAAQSLGFAPLINRHGERIGVGMQMPSVTELIRDQLHEEALYRLLSAVAHGHFWAINRLGFAMNPAQDSTSPITGHTLRGMSKEPNVIGMRVLVAESALALSRVAWYQTLYLGWDRPSMETILESGFDGIGANDVVRFWRTAT
jgi:hypothetical protein